ncbi:hypothetical protein AGMMS49579_15510 [Spirochaetia bacterium]|nr:hypothetical protein AGMMS49579_15510 [Spirochaetia bacterium]
MLKKLVYIIIFINISSNIFSQEDNNYLSLLKEFNDYVNENFISPFDNNNINFINDNYFGFGFKKNPFTNDIVFQYYSIFGCNIDENIYSMTDGIIINIDYKYDLGITITLKNNDLEINYILVKPININEGDIVKKGQLIGRITSPYFSYGPALLLRIEYKKYFFDPYLLLYEIIKYNKK